MKKISMMIAVAALSLSLASCGGKSDAPKTDGADTTAVDSAKEPEVLVKYEALVNKAIELQAKVKKGDASAIKEYTQLSEEMTAMATELSQEVAKMTPQQVEKITELGKKLTESATSMAN